MYLPQCIAGNRVCTFLVQSQVDNAQPSERFMAASRHSPRLALVTRQPLSLSRSLAPLQPLDVLERALPLAVALALACRWNLTPFLTPSRGYRA